MKKLSFICIVCKEKLEIDSNVSSFNCSSCKTPLSVQKTNGIAYLKPMTKDNNETKIVGQTSEGIKLEHLLGRLDREWLIKRESFSGIASYVDYEMDRSAGGKIISRVLTSILVLGLFGFTFIMMYASLNVSWPYFFTYLFLTIFLISTMIREKKYKSLREKYLKERENLKRKLEKNK